MRHLLRVVSSGVRWTQSSASVARPTSNDGYPVVSGGFVDTVGLKYAEIHRQNLQSASEILEYRAKAKSGGGERAIKRHTEVNRKLLVRDRLRLLLDEGTELFEIGPLAGCCGMEYGEVPAAGIVLGIGTVRGRHCMILANDATVKGGTVYPITVKKQLRGQEIAARLRLPCIYVVDSGGAFLPLQRDIFPDKEHGGRVFYNQAVMGAMGIPQIAVICGSCTAGAAYIPTMADDSIIVHRIGSVFLGGPPLVKAALGEEVTSEELGGATLHCGTSGCTDYFAEDEKTAFAMCRDVVSSLSDQSLESSIRTAEQPKFAAEELSGILCEVDATNGREFVCSILSRLLDGSRFREFRQMYGSALIVGQGRIGGRNVAVVASTGISIDEQSAQKACQLVQMCDQRGTPMIFIQNTQHDGWPHAQDGQTTKAVAALMATVANSRCWKIALNVGGSFGSDYFALCGRSFDPIFSFMWSNTKLAMVHPEAIKSVKEKPDDDEYNASYAGSRLWVDDVILPQETRRVLLECLKFLPSIDVSASLNNRAVIRL